jgi:error-prone DNA polymerase
MDRKKGRAEMERWRDTFLEGAAGIGVDKARAMKIFDLICGFAEFGFCKSHAMSFALLCYRSAFLKRYYPLEFYCALLNNQPMGFYIPEVIIGDARRHGVECFPVDVNESLWVCSPEEHGIRLGFRYVKSLGEEGADAIVAERKKGSFRSFKEFCFRVRLDKDALRSLIIIGAFDRLERSRRRLLWALRSVDTIGLREMDLDTAGDAPLDEMTGREELRAAYSIQGFSASSHLVELYRDKLAHQGAVKSSQLSRLASGRAVKIGGYNICLQVPPTAKGFAFITLEDEEGLVNVVLKPNIYRRHRQLVRLKPLLIVDGVVERKDGVINVVAEKVSDMQP